MPKRASIRLKGSLINLKGEERTGHDLVFLWKGSFLLVHFLFLVLPF